MDNLARASTKASRDSAGMSFDAKFDVLRKISEECSNEDRIQMLMEKKSTPLCYVWFLPTPWMHITEGIVKTMLVNKMIKAGYKVKILIADEVALMKYKHNKPDATLSSIYSMATYNINIWRAAGMDMNRVDIRWLSVERKKQDDKFVSLVRRIRQYPLDGIKCRRWVADTFALTPDEAEDLMQLQCAAILYFKDADIWLLDPDQKREVSVLARKYCEEVLKKSVPVTLFINRLRDLLEYPEAAKLRDVTRAISMGDDEVGFMLFRSEGKGGWLLFVRIFKDAVDYKIMFRAFCPAKVVKGNPCLEYIKHVIFPWFGAFEVVHPTDVLMSFTNMEDLIADYESGTLGPVEVKQALVKAINKILKPVHDQYESTPPAKSLRDTYEECYYITCEE